MSSTGVPQGAPEPSARSVDITSDEAQRHERAVNAFEYAAWHLGSAFARWRRDCLSSIPGVQLSGAEASILHIIHLNGTPKGLAEIARLLHRDDLVNLQYGLKKLLSQGFIEKADANAPKKSVTYRASAQGAGVVEAYLQRRRDTLLRLSRTLPGTTEAIEDVAVMLHVMIGLYDQASNIVAGQGGALGALEP
jgi:predicted MarR family transcription regulator